MGFEDEDEDEDEEEDDKQPLAAGEFTDDAAPMPEKMMVAQCTEEVQNHATMPGVSEVGLHGGKLS